MEIEVIAAREPKRIRQILESLPDWFGDPDAIDQYVLDASADIFDSYVVYLDDEVAGVALVRHHFRQSAELHLIAVALQSRGRGLGRRLVEHALEQLTKTGKTYLTVHTVGPSFDHEPYAQTRRFYESLGFIPLEEHNGLDWPGPTLILVRRTS